MCTFQFSCGFVTGFPCPIPSTLKMPFICLRAKSKVFFISSSTVSKKKLEWRIRWKRSLLNSIATAKAKRSSSRRERVVPPGHYWRKNWSVGRSRGHPRPQPASVPPAELKCEPRWSRPGERPPHPPPERHRERQRDLRPSGARLWLQAMARSPRASPLGSAAVSAWPPSVPSISFPFRALPSLPASPNSSLSVSLAWRATSGHRLGWTRGGCSGVQGSCFQSWFCSLSTQVSDLGRRERGREPGAALGSHSGRRGLSPTHWDFGGSAKIVWSWPGRNPWLRFPAGLFCSFPLTCPFHWRFLPF